LDSRSGIVVLDEDCHDPAGDIVEVYDNPHPPLRFECVLAVETLASRTLIVLPVVGLCDGRVDRIDVGRAATSGDLGEVQIGTGIEHDTTAFRVYNGLFLALHHRPDTDW
jgi:hypothetical protein